MKRLAVVFVLAILSGACMDEGPTQVAPGPPALAVLGDGGPHFSPWSTPTVVGAPISSPELWEGCPFISKDGLDLFFRAEVKVADVGWRWDIFVSHRGSVEEPWGTPVNLGPKVNPAASNELCSFVTIDGHWLYFVSNRTDVGSYGGYDIFVSHRKDKRDPTGWETPKNLGPLINTAGAEHGPSIFEDEATGEAVFYFGSSRSGNLDIYSSRMLDKETFEAPTPVVELNTPYNDAHPFIRRKDGLEIIFFSARPGPDALGGNDLYVATRPTTLDPWSAPVNLGPQFNSPYNEARPSISWDGTELYFWTDRDWYQYSETSGWRDMNVYRATRTKLPG